ncbi:hypothetical protein C8N46_101726 [Kordia periserrulae]|uniref:TonB-like protein n=1 Tax=Kordia periserrulae TaxID=701523 RepID=A0A2T6C754_9FLAO|nr:hypothetical protein [Kordia periserrulae]PTX64116.1 hypothetical protein C8N46_101726 [Kordia periserrulae]
MKANKTYIYIALLLVFLSCNSKKETEVTQKPEYLDDIGDTTFNPALDNANFKFCDSTNVLHKRASVAYTGGITAMEKELIKKYKKQPAFESFTGYFFIRFAVNCNNESGRFRWEIVDEEFKETSCPKALEEEIISTVKSLQQWNYPIYRGKSYDGYTFIIVKLKNGNILRS